MNVSRPFLIFLLILVPAVGASAQARKKAQENSLASRLASIKVTGTQRYTEKEIIAATGLQIGQNAGDPDFKAAIARLADTGLFTDLAYSFSSSIEGTKLDLQLADSNDLVPVHFDNIPWFSDQELIEKVQAHVPLFRGQLPAGGNMVDQVADVIEAVLVELNPHLHSTYLRSSANPGDPMDSIVFSVSGTDIRIRRIEFPGAGAALIDNLKSAAAKLQGREYHRNALEKFAQLDLKPIFSRLGYLKVAFGDAQAEVIGSTAEQTTVDVKIPIAEGQQYKLSGISWSGNTIFPAEKLQSQVRLQAGQLVDAVQLAHDLDQIRASYGARGHVKAALEPRPTYDDSSASVAYVIEVEEGDEFRMGELDLEGLDDKTHARLVEDWRLRQGETYDSSYPRRFIKDCQPDLPNAAQWEVKVDESVNDSDKTVDVTLRFIPKSTG